jgi:hypothetical protein
MIDHFFFLSDQRWEGYSLITLFLIQLEGKKKKKEEVERFSSAMREKK